MAHPRSTITNIFIIAAGLAVITTSTVALQVLAGIAIALLGVASAGYHSGGTRSWQRIDIMMIYVTFFVLMAWQLSTFEGFAAHKTYLLAVALAFSVAVGLTYSDWTHKQIGLLAIMNLVILSIRAPYWQVTMAFVLYLFGLWIGLEGEKHEKHTYDYDVLHAVRHVLWAGALFLTAF